VLTTTNAGALVGGAAPSTMKQKTTFIEAVRGFMYAGKPVTVGAVVEVPAGTAAELIGTHKAVAASAPEPKKSTRKEQGNDLQ